MTSNFFQQIAAIGAQGTFKLAITLTKEGTMVVSQLFTADCGDKAVNQIVPLTLSGTPQELDEAFFEHITKPAQQVAGLMANMEAHLKSVETARLASKMEQDKKNKEKKAQDDNGTVKKENDHELPEAKAEKKNAYEQTIKTIGELNDQCKYEEALALLPAEEEYPDKLAELGKLRASLELKIEQKKRLLF